MNQEQLSDNSLAILLLCSHFKTQPAESISPLTVAEWNELEMKIEASEFKSPGSLLGASTEMLQTQLGVPLAEASRLQALLERAGAAGFAIETLSSQGIYIRTRIDPDFPKRINDKLKKQAPPVLFCCGHLDLVEERSVAIVGSRAVDASGEAFTASLARVCAQNKVSVVSGGAKGVDIISMKASLDHGGTSVGVMSDSLARKIRDPFAREAILENRLLLLSPFHPNAGFHVANAMSRNKVIYAFADYAVVVSSDLDQGGTWAGATENLRKGYAPLLVRSGENLPKGNSALMEKGGVPLTQAELEQHQTDLIEFLSQKASRSQRSSHPEQLTLG